jgi:23S rRNA pseudouridine1911/1915/1917 synthase
MKHLLQFQIETGTAGQRLDEYLATQLGRLSRMRIASLLTLGACRVNQTAAHAGYKLNKGDLVEFAFEEGAPTAMEPEAIALEIVFEDEHLVVVVKPAGMLVHPTRGVKSGTLANALAFHLNQPSNSRAPTIVRPGLVHRLDRATSGLMVVAKTERALRQLADHFRRRLVEKRYLALLEGCVQEDAKIISAPIGRDEEAHPKWRVLETGKEAETRLRVLERGAQQTLVELEPVTGRTNQLRIHCALIGHPIVGDEWYGARDAAERLCLHAARLSFRHPAHNEPLEFNSPLPVEIKEKLQG